MTLRVTFGLAIIALGFGLAALAGIPALIENRNFGDVAVVAGLALALAGLLIGLTGIPGELRAWKRHKADRVADVANLKVKRRRIQHTKADAIVRLTEAREDLKKSEADRHAVAYAREQRRNVRTLELENLLIDANLDFNTNEFSRHGVDVEAFDRERNA